MNNRYKFKVISDGNVVIYDGLPEKLLHDDNVMIFQSTGILDKSGRLIFEGDKVVAEISYENLDGTVVNEKMVGEIYWESKGCYYNIVCDDFVCGLGLRGQKVEVLSE